MAKRKTLKNPTTKNQRMCLLPAPLKMVANAITAQAITDPRTFAFLALPLVVLKLDQYDTEVALWPQVIAARLNQAAEIGLAAAMAQATAAEICAYMESVSRYHPPDDSGIMVGVFRHAMYLMLTGSGYPADQLPDSIRCGAVLAGEAAALYLEITTAIRAAQLASIEQALPIMESERGLQAHQ